LVRAHLTHNPLLPTNEVIVLKQGIAVLSRIGKLMAQNTRRAAEQGDLPAVELSDEFPR
jgi:hypothetical protein